MTSHIVPLLSPSYRQTKAHADAAKNAAKDRKHMRYGRDGDTSRREAVKALIPVSNLDVSPEAIGGLFRKANGSLLECGHRLLAKRISMQHGEWLPWLEANSEILGFGERTAQLLIKAAKTFPQLTSDLPDAELNRLIWGNTSKPAPRISLEQAAASFLPMDESIVATVPATAAAADADVESQAIVRAATMVGVSEAMVREAMALEVSDPAMFKRVEAGEIGLPSETIAAIVPPKAPAPSITVNEAVDLLELDSSKRQIVSTYKGWRGKVNQLRNQLAKAEVEFAEAEKALLKAAIQKRGES